MSEENLSYYVQHSLPNSTSWSGQIQPTLQKCQTQPELDDPRAYNTRRSWARSKRISLGCLEWRTSNHGPNRSSRSKSGGRRKSVGCETSYLPESEVTQSAGEFTGFQLYRTCRSKASLGADALLRRLRMRSLVKDRRSRSKTGEDLQLACSMQRSCSTPRPCHLSESCEEWQDQNAVFKSRSCGSHLNSTKQSVLSLKSAPEMVSSSTTVDYNRSNSRDGRRSTRLAELRTRYFIPPTSNHIVNITSQTDPMPTPYGTCPCFTHTDALPGRPRSSCDSQLYRPQSQPSCVCTDPAIHRYPPENRFPTNWSSTLPMSPSYVLNPAHMSIPTSGHVISDYHEPNLLRHCSAVVGARYPHGFVAEHSLHYPHTHHGQSTRHSGVIYAAPNQPVPSYAPNYPPAGCGQHQPVGQTEGTIYASSFPTNRSVIPDSVSESTEQTLGVPPAPPPLPMPMSMSNYSLTSSITCNHPTSFGDPINPRRLQNQTVYLSSLNPPQDCHTIPTTHYAHQLQQDVRPNYTQEHSPGLNQKEDSRTSNKVYTQAYTRPDSLLSGSSLTAESSVSDSLHNSSSSRDSALGGNPPLSIGHEARIEETRTHAEPNTRNGMALTMDQLHPGSTEMEPPSSASTIRTLRSRSQIVPPPLPPISTSYDLKIPPTPRRTKPSWVIHDMDGTKPTLRISQQVRSERRHDVYVNAAKCPVPDHHGSQPNGRSAVGRLSPPAVWTQLLPYRVSTVPPNLSERLKKSETLPNDVWTYSQSSPQDHSQRAVSGVLSGTKGQQFEDIRSEGPRSPPPRPPVRTTSQIPTSMCVKDHPGATGHASSARKAGVQQKGVSNYQSLADMYGVRESFDNSPVLCRYAQLYSMPFHPKTPKSRGSSCSTTKAQQSPSAVSIHSPLKENRRKSPASYMERLHLAE